MASTGAYFIDYHPETGQPYIGYVFTGDGISMQTFIADKLTAKQTLKTFEMAVAELMETKAKSMPPKLVQAKGPLPKGDRNAGIR